LAVDLSSGFIWGELSEQVNRWIERINQSVITKCILYLSALEEGDRLDLARIQKEILKREGKDRGRCTRRRTGSERTDHHLSQTGTPVQRIQRVPGGGVYGPGAVVG